MTPNVSNTFKRTVDGLVGKFEGKITLPKRRHRWEDNTKVNLMYRSIEREDVDSIPGVEDKVQ
jgi:hypothetical protein